MPQDADPTALLRWIRVKWADSHLAFSLADDGVGFDVDNPKESPATGHLGLASLRDRIERLMGTIEIESQVSAGNTLRGRVPLINEAHRPQQREVSTYLLNNQQATEWE